MANIADIWASMPDYVKSAATILAATLVSGLLLAWLTTLVFERVNEVTRIKGLVIERRLEVYKELARRLEAFNNMVYFRPEQVELQLRLLHEAGVQIPAPGRGVSIQAIFQNFEALRRDFLDFENYALENRIFFDTKVYDEVNFLQNYLGFYTHIPLLFAEQLALEGKDPDKEESKKIGDALLRAVGIMLGDEFGDQISRAIDTIRNSIANISLSTRSEQLHTYDYYNNPEGEFMKRMASTRAAINAPAILRLTALFAAITP